MKMKKILKFVLIQRLSFQQLPITKIFHIDLLMGVTIEILISILSENDNKICHLLKFFIVSAFFSFLVIASIIFGLIDLRIFIGDFCFYAIFITTFYFMTCFLTKDISKLYFSLSRYYLFSYVSFYFILKGKARF